MLFQNSYWIVTVAHLWFQKPRPEINSDWHILFLYHYQNIFTLPLTENCFLLFALPYYSGKSPNPCYYYCDCYFILIIIVVTIVEQVLDVWFEKIQPSILILVISVCEKLNMKYAGIWYIFPGPFHCDTGE